MPVAAMCPICLTLKSLIQDFTVGSVIAKYMLSVSIFLHIMQLLFLLNNCYTVALINAGFALMSSFMLKFKFIFASVQVNRSETAAERQFVNNYRKKPCLSKGLLQHPVTPFLCLFPQLHNRQLVPIQPRSNSLG